MSISDVTFTLESVFHLVNDRFYDGSLEVPVITVSPNSRQDNFGWFTLGKVWKCDDGTEQFEINICAEYLNRPLEDVVSTLLHEIVHLYCHTNGIKDTSRGATYHNRRFKEQAELHGLTVECDAKYGWTITSLNEDGLSFVKELEIDGFKLHRDSSIVEETPKGGSGGKKSSSRKYVCPQCGTSVRATKEVHVACGDCQVMMVEEV